MDKEQLLAIFLDTDPSVRSRYKITGCRPMWKVMSVDNYTIYACPSRTMERPKPYMPYQEVDGVAYGFQKDDQWIGQECSSTFENFIEAINNIPNKGIKSMIHT